MAWIESHQELGRHPKARKAARALGVGLPALVGHLHYLWWWTMDYAPDGSLARFDAADIAEAALWEGDAHTFMAALAGAGFLDETNDGGYAIHDWETYGGKLAARRRAGAVRQALWRERHHTESVTASDAHVTAPVTLNNAARREERTGEKRREEERTRAAEDTTSQTAQAHAVSAHVSSSAVGAGNAAPPSSSSSSCGADETPDTSPAATAAGAATAITAATSPPSGPAPRPPKSRKTAGPVPALPIGPLWEACVQAIGHQPQTRTESGGWAAQVRQLAEAGATPEEVVARVRRYCAKYGRERLTIFALVKHWGEFALEGSPSNAHGQTGAAQGAAERERDAQRRASEARRTRAELEDLLARAGAAQ